jgi:hypothetical protein
MKMKNGVMHGIWNHMAWIYPLWNQGRLFFKTVQVSFFKMLSLQNPENPSAFKNNSIKNLPQEINAGGTRK